MPETHVWEMDLKYLRLPTGPKSSLRASGIPSPRKFAATFSVEGLAARIVMCAPGFPVNTCSAHRHGLFGSAGCKANSPTKTTQR